jgi:hypothetical protein
MLKNFRLLKSPGIVLPLPAIAFSFLMLLTIPQVHAQTKVFKAVAADMDQDFEAIYQDNRLVGYLMFTQLEKASADSFNYRLSIMDENLNDIGTVNFREQKLNLKSVSFDQDILCLAYVQSNFVGKEYKNGKEFRRDADNAKSALFTQFIGLDGRIIATNRLKLDIKPEEEGVDGSYRKVVGNGRLKHGIQLANIAGKGFACFYGDDSKRNLVIFNTAGKLTWQKQIHEDGTNFTMLASGPEVSFLVKQKEKMEEGGYEVIGYNAIDSAVYPKIVLQDKRGNSLKVLAFNNDPATGKPFVSGMIIDPRKGNNFYTGRGLVHGTYCGVFSISFNGHTRKDIQTSYSYWADGPETVVDRHGYFEEPGHYAKVGSSFRDYQGNTYFVGAGISRKPRWVAISIGVVTLPTLVIPMACMLGGTHKYYAGDVMLFKQDPAGKLSIVNTVPTPRSAPFQASSPEFQYMGPGYYKLSNPDTHTDYLVINNAKDIDIYNINQKKVARTIPRKEGNNLITVFPAKEGYVMVRNFDKKDGSTRLSIESL